MGRQIRMKAIPLQCLSLTIISIVFATTAGAARLGVLPASLDPDEARMLLDFINKR